MTKEHIDNLGEIGTIISASVKLRFINIEALEDLIQDMLRTSPVETPEKKCVLEFVLAAKRLRDLGLEIEKYSNARTEALKKHAS